MTETSRLCVSFSGLQLHEQCPSAFQRKYILKEPVVSEGEASPALVRGNRVHREIELYLLGELDELPQEALGFEGLIDGIKDERDHHPEMRWGLDKDFKVVSFDDKANAICRGMLDLAYQHDDIAHIKEWKTGKMYGEHAEQRSMYGLAGLSIFPDAKAVQVDTIYLDAGIVHPTTFASYQAPSLQWIWGRKINAVQPPKPYPQKKSWKCKFCLYHEDKGGTCNGKST